MSTNTTNLSRRRLLANSAPAIAAAALAPAAATALCRLPAESDDPIFGAIEQHRQASEAYNTADEIFHRLAKENEAQRNPNGVYLGEYPEIKYELTDELVEVIQGTPPIQKSRAVHTVGPRYATLPREIEDNVPADCADPEAWKAQKYREYDEWSGTNEGSPREVAWHAWNQAHRRYVIATAALGVRPTTMPGMAAMLRYIAEFHDAEVWTDAIYEEDDEDGERPPVIDNDGLLLEILETLADAAESLCA